MKSDFYDGFLCPKGCEGAIAVTMERGKDRLYLLSVLTPQADRSANADTGAVLTQIAPDLRKALRLADAMKEAVAQTAAIEAAVEGLGIGVLLVGPDMRPLRQSDTAKTYLAAGSFLSLTRTGRLHFVDDGCMAALRAMLVWPPAGPDRFVGRVIGKDGAILRMSMVRIGGAGPTPTLEGCAVVLILEPERRPALPAKGDLIRRFRLTPAEADTLAALCDGESVAQLATRRGISESTVRSQIKALFAKTGTTRQIDLIRIAGGTGAGV